MLNANSTAASGQDEKDKERGIGSLERSKTGSGAGGAVAAASIARARPVRMSRPGTLLCRQGTTTMGALIDTFTQRGDLAHLALFLWASAATALLVFVTREFAAASRRFDDFVRELARFNDRIKGRK